MTSKRGTEDHAHFCKRCSPDAQNRTNRSVRPCCNVMLLRAFVIHTPLKVARRVDVGSACVDIRQSQKTDVLVIYYFAYSITRGLIPTCLFHKSFPFHHKIFFSFRIFPANCFLFCSLSLFLLVVPRGRLSWQRQLRFSSNAKTYFASYRIRCIQRNVAL